MTTADRASVPTSVKVWIDFVCPYCFLAEQPLRQAMDGLNVAVEWMAFELRPYPVETLRPEGAYLQSAWRNSVYPLAQRMGIPIRLPAVSPQPYSRLAFEGLAYAREHGKADEYVDAVLRAFFQQGLDIGQLEVLQEIAADAGLRPHEFTECLRQGRYSQAHDDALQIARDFGIRAVPTIIVGQHRFEGVPGVETLRQAIAASRLGD